MTNSIKPRLLLPHTQNILVKADGNDLLLVEFPEWLSNYLGISHQSIINSSINGILKSLLPEMSELIQRTMESNKPIRGYEISVEDQNLVEHKITVDSEFLKKGSQDYVAAYLQEIPSSLYSHSNLEEAYFMGLVGVAPKMHNVFNKIRMYAVSEAPVLITGETGAGKEGVAEAIHKLSKRSNRPFITMNCSAITDTLFESELFGHEKGSFTGAIKSHKGRFERAHTGTLFLDEIGDLPPASQAKLLRVLETSTIERVGGEQSIKVDVRIVAATNKNLEIESLQNNYRSDLFYRINALQIKLPPLRERTEDIEYLIAHFIRLLNERYDRDVVCLTREALELIKQYKWPGNIRELRNLMERLFAENQTRVIGLKALKEWYEDRVEFLANSKYDPNVTVLPYQKAIPLGMPTISDANLFSEAEPLQPSYSYNNKKELDEADLKEAYFKADGNITKASEILGIHKATFYRTLKNLNLSREDLER